MLNIDIVSDFVCPWCYIGHHRLSQALANTGQQALLRFRPFLLNPQLPPQGIPRSEYVQQKFGDRAESFYAHIAQVAAADGLKMQFDRITHQPNTFAIHRLVIAAQIAQPEIVEDFILRLFRAFLEQGQNLNDADTVARLYSSAGGDKQKALQILQNDEYAQDVRQALEVQQQYGITGVPFFVVKPDKGAPRGIPGAVEQAAWEKLLLSL